MSRITEQLTAAGQSIEDEIRQALDNTDIGMQLRNIRVEVLAEKRLSDDRFETLMKRFDAIDAQLHSIAMALSTNGSGGRHG